MFCLDLFSQKKIMYKLFFYKINLVEIVFCNKNFIIRWYPNLTFRGIGKVVA